MVTKPIDRYAQRWETEPRVKPVLGAGFSPRTVTMALYRRSEGLQGSSGRSILYFLNEQEAVAIGWHGVSFWIYRLKLWKARNAAGYSFFEFFMYLFLLWAKSLFAIGRKADEICVVRGKREIQQGKKKTCKSLTNLKITVSLPVF